MRTLHSCQVWQPKKRNPQRLIEESNELQGPVPEGVRPANQEWGLTGCLICIQLILFYFIAKNIEMTEKLLSKAYPFFYYAKIKGDAGK
jgi:hypothetical protein